MDTFLGILMLITGLEPKSVVVCSWLQVNDHYYPAIRSCFSNHYYTATRPCLSNHYYPATRPCLSNHYYPATRPCLSNHYYSVTGQVSPYTEWYKSSNDNLQMESMLKKMIRWLENAKNAVNQSLHICVRYFLGDRSFMAFSSMTIQ